MHEVPSCMKPALHLLQFRLEPSQLRQLSSHLGEDTVSCLTGPLVPNLLHPRGSHSLQKLPGCNGCKAGVRARFHAVR